MFSSRRKGKRIINGASRAAQKPSVPDSPAHMASYAKLLTIGGKPRSANTTYIPGAYWFSYEPCNTAKERTAEAGRPP